MIFLVLVIFLICTSLKNMTRKVCSSFPESEFSNFMPRKGPLLKLSYPETVSFLLNQLEKMTVTVNSVFGVCSQVNGLFGSKILVNGPLRESGLECNDTRGWMSFASRFRGMNRVKKRPFPEKCICLGLISRKACLPGYSK